MMQVPDHLSVTGADLISLEPISNLMNRLESARSALIEKMSVPEHITVYGEEKTVIPDERIYRQSALRMEVPSHLNVFHLSETSENNNMKSKTIVNQSTASSNLENPFEEAKMMRKQFVIMVERIRMLETQIDVQKRRERVLLLALIGAALTMAWNCMKR